MKNKVKEFVKWLAYIGDVLVGLMFLLAIIGLCVLGMYTIFRHIGLRPAEDPSPAEPAEGVAWVMPEAGEVPVWLSPICAGEAETAVWLESYTEGDGPAPEWYRPDEPMSAEWSAEDINVPCNAPQSDGVDYNPHPPIGIDPGGVDWNLCTTVWGWDGHGAEVWELDLLARVFYLEFWGTSLPCSEAGCDAILNLWDTGKYGRTLFDALSYYDPQYGYTYRVYPRVWETTYDPDGLEWCREFCTERFINGPEWGAVYFQLGGYHDQDWVPALYEMDGVYFSGASEVQ